MPQKMARGFKFQISEDEGLYYLAKTKALGRSLMLFKTWEKVNTSCGMRSHQIVHLKLKNKNCQKCDSEEEVINTFMQVLSLGSKNGQK